MRCYWLENMRHTISVLVENEFGVLARIAGLFSGRGYNIDSLTVSETLDKGVSRMTIVTQGNERIIEQIIKQLNRLINVIRVEDLTEEDFVERQLIVVKVSRSENHSELLKSVEHYGGSIVDDESETYLIEFSGDHTVLEQILEALSPFGILEFICSGSIAMSKGPKVLKELD